jgi:lipopolysaccharide transport protein LptA
MKTTYLIAITATLLLSGRIIAQEGNSAYKDLLENKHTQDILRSLKNDPEKAAKAAQNNPDELIRNATAIFAEKQKKTNPGEVSATRSKTSQADRALANMKNLIARPVPGDTQALPVPVNNIRNLKVDSSKISKLKEAAKETIPELSNLIPNDPPSKPTIQGVPKLPEIKAVHRPVETVAELNTSPLNVSPRDAPPAPLRNMEPTVPQIPDSPELFSSAPKPEALGRRYPKPKKFQPAIAAADENSSTPKPKSDTMVITSSESEMDNKNHELTFRGDVLVEMDGMELRCDTLYVYLDDKNEMKTIVATGGMVEIKKIGEGGKLQVAKARRAEHVAATSTTTLSGGPPYLQNGDQYVNTDSEDSKIILGGDGKYKVLSPKAKGRTVIVVPIGNGKKFNTDLGIDKKLKGIGQ